VASVKVSGAVASVFAALTVTFVLLTAGALGQHPDISKAGGAAGISTAVLAWYASFAGVTNETWKRTVLPTAPAPRWGAAEGSHRTTSGRTLRVDD
jgi:succinate-acetate transporter protein